MSAINPALLRAYDLRGRVGSDLTEADATALGLAYATRLRARGGRTVAVGYDGRLSSPALAQALVAGLVAGGLLVRLVGRGPIGRVYFAREVAALDGAVMVTGSHNPPDQNGFKLLAGAEPIHGAELAALIGAPGLPMPGGAAADLDVEPAYLAVLVDAAAGAPALRIGWDAGNGATGEMLTALTGRLPGTHRLLNTAIDGTFPAHHPDPAVPDNLAQLQALVRAERLDLGIAFDGDGDRIGVVDGTGAMLFADQLMLLLAQDVLRDHPGAAIVADVKSSRVLLDGIVAAGGRTLLSPSGYVLVRAATVAADAPLGGEMSGHIFYRDRWHGSDDALYVAMRLLAALGRAGTSLAAFRAGLPATFATPELRLACADGDKAPVLAAVAARLSEEGAAVDRTDGLRVAEPDGWWLLRASGTEPKLTARVEGWSEAARERLEARLFGLLREAGWR